MEEKQHHAEHSTYSHHEEQHHNPYTLQTLLAWDAPGRPFKKHGRQYFATILLLAFLIEVILFLFSQYALMAVVASLVFLSFVIALTPPRNFHYRISTEGIMVEDHFFLWQELYDFYFKRRGGLNILHVRTDTLYPGEITITLGDIAEQHVKSVLLPYLPYREYVKPTVMEKSADWLSRNFPLEKE